MTRHFWLLLITLLVPANAAAWEGVVVKVLDGDSLRVQAGGKITEIRLYGIDTPEYGQAYGNKAKQFSRRLILGQQVDVREMDTDHYGRTVALVSTGSRLLNRELVRAGLAWHYPSYCRLQPLCTELKQLQAAAEKEGRGLWRDKNPLPPWQWKRSRRQDNQ
jgi:micrococcal nuclease